MGLPMGEFVLARALGTLGLICFSKNCDLEDNNDGRSSVRVHLQIENNYTHLGILAGERQYGSSRSQNPRTWDTGSSAEMFYKARLHNPVRTHNTSR